MTSTAVDTKFSFSGGSPFAENALIILKGVRFAAVGAGFTFFGNAYAAGLAFSA